MQSLSDSDRGGNEASSAIASASTLSPASTVPPAAALPPASAFAASYRLSIICVISSSLQGGGLSEKPLRHFCTCFRPYFSAHSGFTSPCSAPSTHTRHDHAQSFRGAACQHRASESVRGIQLRSLSRHVFVIGVHCRSISSRASHAVFTARLSSDVYTRRMRLMPVAAPPRTKQHGKCLAARHVACPRRQPSPPFPWRHVACPRFQNSSSILGHAPLSSWPARRASSRPRFVKSGSAQPVKIFS